MKTSPHITKTSPRALLPFFLITFGITWGIIALYILFPDLTGRLFGELTGRHPLFYLGVYSPAIAAFILIARRSGIGGMRRFASRALLWRCSPGWVAFLLVGVPIPFLIGAALGGKWPTDYFPFDSVSAYLAALFFMAIKGPVEEFGWRGFALPLLQRRLAPIWASLLLGVVWGLWHLPIFFLSGVPQSAWSFTPFFIGTMALSVIVTPLFNQSRGSILLPALFHLQLINPLWPDAQPWDTWLFVIVAVVIVWINRATMFNRASAITTIIPDA